MLELLEGWLRHKSDMVNVEAARAICEMRNVTAQQLIRPIAGESNLQQCVYIYLIFLHKVLQLCLSSPKSPLKFAAIRTLASFALTHPGSVATCNVEMEHLISDPNRSIATYAITTLLKVGNHTSCTTSLFDSHITDWDRSVC